jgi:hypothetical protein
MVQAFQFHHANTITTGTVKHNARAVKERVSVPDETPLPLHPAFVL